MKKILKIIILSFFVLCTYMIHFDLLSVKFESDLIIENSFLLYFVIAIFIYFIDKHKTNNGRAKKASAFIGIFFSVSMVIDLSCSYNHTAANLFLPLQTIPVVLIEVIGYSVIFYYILCAIFKFVLEFENSKAALLSNKLSKFLGKVLNKKGFIKIWGFIMLLYLPYLILVYPGVMLGDNYDMLCKFFSGKIDNHDPIFQTLIFGNFVLYGIRGGVC